MGDLRIEAESQFGDELGPAYCMLEPMYHGSKADASCMDRTGNLHADLRSAMASMGRGLRACVI